MNDFLHSLRNGQADKPRAPKTRKSYDNSYQYSSNSRFHSYGNGYQNPRNPNMKRPPLPPGPMGNQLPPEDPGITLLADAIENLTHHVEILVKNQEYLTSVQERTADMLERQAFAIERIVSHLRIAPTPQQASRPHAAPSRHETLEETDAAMAHQGLENPVASKDAHPEIPEDPRETQFPENNTAPPAETAPKTQRRVIKKRKKAAPDIPQPKSFSGSRTLLPREQILHIIQTMRNEGATYDQIAKHLVDLGQPTFSGRGEWHAQTIHRLCSKK
jgi:hypothetical protein